MTCQKRAIRIAGCSGSASDRRDAMRTLAANHAADSIDLIIGDWLSEANMTSRGASKAEKPDVPAYEPTFLEALDSALPDLAKHRIRLAVNAGAADTPLLHKRVTEMVAEKGLMLRVAWISGDEVLPAISKALTSKTSTFKNIYTGETLAKWKFEPAYAQAYLGGLGIAAALSAGADIVICGRVSDASPVIGAAVWWHGWDRTQLDQLANALVAGHLIECSSYVCGGNFSGFRLLERWDDIGYPIAEISADGAVVITKNKGSGGEVSVNTCTAQLLYEIQGPWYFNSDVTAILDGISFEQLSTDRVALCGVKSGLPPPTTKVGITAKGGYQAEMHWFIVGLDFEAKAAMMETQIRRLLAPYSSAFTVLEFTLHGTCPEDPKNQPSATVDLRVLAQAPTRDDLAPAKFARPCLDVMMSGYPGATPNLDMRTAFGKPIYEYYVTLLPQSSIHHRVHLPWLASTTPSTITIPPPPETHTYPTRQPTSSSATAPTTSRTNTHTHTHGGRTDAAGAWAEMPPQPGRSVIREAFGPFGRTVRGPLGWLAYARSGDKGSDCNVGLWVPRGGEEWEWLRGLLSVGKMRELLAEEDSGGEVERFEVPGCRAVHFLLRGHLDRGASCNRTYDVLGKQVAEFVRARYVDLPVRFLERGRL